MKHIWIVNCSSAPPEYEKYDRHLKLAEYLQNRGYKVTIFSSGFLHGRDIDLTDNGKLFKRAVYDGKYNFVHVKTRHYKGNGIDRIISIFLFAWRILRHRDEFEKPDIIYHNMHAPFDYPICECARKMGVRYIAEEWDLWPEFFVTFGLISAGNPLMKWAYGIERRMFEAATDVVFSFAGGMDYLRKKGWTTRYGGKIAEENVHYINNGFDSAEFQVNKEKCFVDDSDLHDDNIFKITYVGSLRLANDVRQLIEAMEQLTEYRDIKLIIYGHGNQREGLETYVREKRLENVTFKAEHIPLSHCAYIQSRGDLNILNYKKGFGDYGISAGKFIQSLAAGKPMVCNVPIMYDDVINDHNLGICDTLDTPQKYAAAILKIYNLPKDEYDSMCRRVREVAGRFDYNELFGSLIKVIEK